MERVAAVLGHLARAGGTLTAEFVEFEVRLCLARQPPPPRPAIPLLLPLCSTLSFVGQLESFLFLRKLRVGSQCTAVGE